jgi:magnesium-transporting ATPase (P-type)
VNLRIEESALTGESVPTEKHRPRSPPTPAWATASMAYSGTMVAAGRGSGVVTATGPATELGRINKMIADVEKLATPLTRQMNRFGKILSVIIVGWPRSVVGRWLLHDFTWTSCSWPPSASPSPPSPKGLPAILTITLALGVQRMARRNAITRKLNAVETLGSVTVICSDKTGTLTRNEMTARHVVTRAGRYDVAGTGYQPEGRITRDGQDARRSTNTPDLQRAGRGHGRVQRLGDRRGGRPVEGHRRAHRRRLRTLARKAGFDEQDPTSASPSIPFESDNKFMATLNRVPGGGRRILLKGAPDRLLDRCRSSGPPTDRPNPRPRVLGAADRGTQQPGLRVLAAAAREVDDDKARLGARGPRAGTWSSWAWSASSIRRGPRPSRPSESAIRPASASR